MNGNKHDFREIVDSEAQLCTNGVDEVLYLINKSAKVTQYRTTFQEFGVEIRAMCQKYTAVFFNICT